MITTLKEMSEVTQDKLSKKNFHIDPNGEVELIGKWSISVQNEDKTWDVWLCNPKDMGKGLTTNRVNAIRGRFDLLKQPTGPYKELNGEGVYLSMPLDTLLSGARYVGLRVKRVVTPEQREMARERFAKIRADRAV